MRTLLSLGIVCAALLANETNLKNELNNEEIRANMASSFNESSNINLLNEKPASEGKLNLNETPCFKIDKISLLSENEVASFNVTRLTFFVKKFLIFNLNVKNEIFYPSNSISIS